MVSILLMLTSCGIYDYSASSYSNVNYKKYISYEGGERSNGIVYIGISFDPLSISSHSISTNDAEQQEIAQILKSVCSNWGYESDYFQDLGGNNSECISHNGYRCTEYKLIAKFACKK